MTQATDETENAISLLMEHFVLGQDRSRYEIDKALGHVSQAQQFDALGRATCMAMLKAHVARLQTDRALLVANLHRGGGCND